jgi:O-antigen/teichoic acid export membrane protein
VADGATAAAARASRNSVVRAAAELLTKIGALALIFVLARAEGPQGVGIYVLALAWAEILVTPVEMGFDRWLLREVAADRSRLPELFGAVIWAKLRRAVPVLAIGAGVVLLVGYDERTLTAIAIVTVGWALYSLSFTVLSVFTAFERAGPSALTMLAQRLGTSLLGLAALAAGLGVLGVAAAYLAGTAASLAFSLWLLRRHLGLPPFLVRGREREASRAARSFAAQEILAAGVGRADAVLLSLLATTVAVGTYGAAYRLLEASLFVPLAVTAACAAMFTYLGHDTDPPVVAVLQRALKAVLGLMLPVALVLGLLAQPVISLFFGRDFPDAADPLRILAPVVLLLSLTLVTNSLCISRGRAGAIARGFAVALAVDVLLCVLLIPPYGAVGAAVAMLGTYIVFAAVSFGLALREVGPPAWGPTLAAPVGAGAAMAAVLAALGDLPLLAGAAGALVYVAVWAAIDRRVSPADLDWLIERVRARLPRRAVA